MNAAHVAQAGRAFAEALMTSTCTLRQPDGEWVTDPATGEASQTAGATVYSGKCRVRPAGRESQPTDAGGAEVFTFDYVVSIPFAVAGAREGQIVTVDSSPDAALVGTVVQVQKVDRGDHITARRLSCNEVS